MTGDRPCDATTAVAVLALAARRATVSAPLPAARRGVRLVARRRARPRAVDRRGVPPRPRGLRRVPRLSAARTSLDATTADVEAVPRVARRRARARPPRSRALASTLRGLYGFLARRGRSSTPTRRRGSRARRGATRLPDGPQRGPGRRPSSPRRRPTRPSTCATARSSSSSTAPACASPSSVGLDLGDVDFDEELVRVTGKGVKQRLVPLGRGAAAALRALARSTARAPSSCSAGGPSAERRAVFCNHRGRRLTRQGVDLVVRRHARRAGLPAATSAHTLRHSCATHMLARGRGRPRDPRAAGPRLGGHDPALHQGRPRPPGRGLPCRASEGR